MTVHIVEGLIRKSGSGIQRHVHDTEHETTFIWRLLELSVFLAESYQSDTRHIAAEQRRKLGDLRLLCLVMDIQYTSCTVP